MVKDFLLGFDIGTTTSKGVIIDYEGKIYAEASSEHSIEIPKPSWAEQDAEKYYWGDFKVIIKKMLFNSQINPQDIKAIGVSGLNPSMVPISSEGKQVRPCIIYLDTRAIEECKKVKEDFGEEKIFKISGTPITPTSSGYKMMWYAKNERDHYKNTWKLVDSHAFIVYKLTGEVALDYGTANTFAPLFDMKNLRWSEEICEECNVCMDKLPSTFPANKVIGEVSKHVALETGLAEGTKVVLGGGIDGFASAYSAGMTEPGDTICVYGGTHVLATCIDKPKLVKGFYCSPYVIPGYYGLSGAMASTGTILKWFRDEFSPIKEFRQQISDAKAYEILDLEASKVPKGSDGLIVLPYFGGERTPIWDPYAKGMIFGLSLTHTKAHVFRAVMEGIGYGLMHNIEVLKENDISPKRMTTVGAGARSKVFRQIISDIINIPQDIVEKASAPIGDAFIAGLGVGIIKNFKDIKKWVKITETVEPNPKFHKKYIQFYKIYRKLYENTKEEMHQLSNIYK